VTVAVHRRFDAEMPLSKNARTGLILATVALAFFVGIILKYWLIR
jgi:hypothetical protein